MLRRRKPEFKTERSVWRAIRWGGRVNRRRNVHRNTRKLKVRQSAVFCPVDYIVLGVQWLIWQKRKRRYFRIITASDADQTLAGNRPQIAQSPRELEIGCSLYGPIAKPELVGRNLVGRGERNSSYENHKRK